MIAKGKSYGDGTYIYVCKNCNGSGHFASEPCPHCYNLDYSLLLQHFATARGERYYAILKAILSIKGKAIVTRAREMIEENKGMKVADLCHLLMEFEFPVNRMKPLVEYLEECHVIRTGVYWRMKEGGFKVKKSLIELGYEV